MLCFVTNKHLGSCSCCEIFPDNHVSYRKKTLVGIIMGEKDMVPLKMSVHARCCSLSLPYVLMVVCFTIYVFNNFLDSYLTAVSPVNLW